MAALLKIAPVVNRISRRAIDFRPNLNPNIRKENQYFSLIGGFLDGRELDCNFDFAGSILQALLWPLP